MIAFDINKNCVIFLNAICVFCKEVINAKLCDFKTTKIRQELGQNSCGYIWFIFFYMSISSKLVILAFSLKFLPSVYQNFVKFFSGICIQNCFLKNLPLYYQRLYLQFKVAFVFYIWNLNESKFNWSLSRSEYYI